MLEPDRASMSDDPDDAAAQELEEEAVYQRAFDDSRRAMKSSEANAKESSHLRDELNEYIVNLQDKKGSDGQALIRVPSNFETIVHSMNREDLTAKESEDRPWSHYLLLDGLNAEEDQEYQGRYNHVFSETKDVKIERGLAEIQLLDRQLKSAARKGASRGDEGGGEGEGAMQDRTFITKPSSSSGASSPMTGRSQLSSRDASGSGGTIPAMKSAAATILAEQRHLQREQGASKKQQKLATAEQQRRLRVLLSDDADDDMAYLDEGLERELREVEAKLAPFGRLQRAAADEAVEEEEKGKKAELEDGESESLSVQDYLLQQRIAREENIRVARVEQMLKQCVNGPINYDALVAKDVASGSITTRSLGSRGGNMSARSSASSATSTPAYRNEVPLPEQVASGPRQITQEDICALIESIRTSLPASGPATEASRSAQRLQEQRWQQQGEEWEGGMQGESRQEGELGTGEEREQEDRREEAEEVYAGADSPGTSPARPAENSGPQPLAPTEQIRQLVRAYKGEIEALGRARERHQRGESLLAGLQELSSLPVGAASAAAVSGRTGGRKGKGKGGAAGGIKGLALGLGRLRSVAEAGAGGEADSPLQQQSQKENPFAVSAEDTASLAALAASMRLDLSEVAPESTVNMAHPALSAAVAVAATTRSPDSSRPSKASPVRSRNHRKETAPSQAQHSADTASASAFAFSGEEARAVPPIPQLRDALLFAACDFDLRPDEGGASAVRALQGQLYQQQTQDEDCDWYEYEAEAPSSSTGVRRDGPAKSLRLPSDSARDVGAEIDAAFSDAAFGLSGDGASALFTAPSLSRPGSSSDRGGSFFDSSDSGADPEAAAMRRRALRARNVLGQMGSSGGGASASAAGGSGPVVKKSIII